MICSRRLYKGNSYEICLPLTDSGVTLARFYTAGDIIIEKVPEITGDSMCFSFTEEEIASLPDGVLRYELVTEHETTDTNSPYVIVTPGDYSGQTLNDMLEEAYESGYTNGQENCTPIYSAMPLTFEILSAGTINWVRHYGESGDGRTIEYSMDNGTTWQSITSNAAPNVPTISVEAGDIIQFRGNNEYYGNETYGNSFSGSTAVFNIYGNIMSLVDSTNYQGLTSVADYAFEVLFWCTKVVEADCLILPALNLGDWCYTSMFSKCENLTKTPELPATTLSVGCYSNMFQGTRSLEKVPELPAPILAERCYEYMFQGVNPNLHYIKCLATDISANDSTRVWVWGAPSAGTFVKACGMEDWTIGSFGIPSGWTVETYPANCGGCSQQDLDAAYASGWSAGYESGITDCSGQTPVYSGYLAFDILSSGTLSWYNGEEDFTSDYSTCYLKYRVNGGEWGALVNNTVHDANAVSSITLNAGDMVEFKTDSLNYNLVASTSGTHYRFKSSESLRYNISGNIMSLIYPEDQFQTATTFPEVLYGESDWFDQLFESGINEGGPVDASNLELPATDLTTKCYRHLFYACTTLTAAPELPATNLANNCYSSMFSGCTGLTTPPVLPATTLAEYCYHFMFQGCTGLASAPELPATTLATGSYRGMFHGCTSLNYVKCLATDISADNCTQLWLYNASATGTFVKASGMNDWTSGSNGIPTGWTVSDAVIE